MRSQRNSNRRGQRHGEQGEGELEEELGARHTRRMFVSFICSKNGNKRRQTTGLPEWAQAPIPGPVSRGNGKGSTSQHKTCALPVACKAELALAPGSAQTSFHISLSHPHPLFWPLRPLRPQQAHAHPKAWHALPR